MRKTFLALFLFMLSVFILKAQPGADPIEGTVSYVTSQSVYVKFKSTKSISEGDTLFRVVQGNRIPVLIVKSLSSTSSVCSQLTTEKFKPGDKVIAINRLQSDAAETQVKADVLTEQNVKPEPIPINDSLGQSVASKPPAQQKVNGRVSIASYSNLSNSPSGNSQRMRYTLSLNAKNIGNSKLSGESYISFVHKDKQWGEIKDNIFNGLKIYNLSVNYEISKNAMIWAGRKINPKLSNMGAVDGVQFEIKTNSITTGILAGSRPDYQDYGFNTSLLQYGVYINHEITLKKGNFQSSLAFVDQKNAGITDRRFAYLQHSNSFIKNLSFFGSAEFDLYRYVAEVKDNSAKLSNLFLSLRYRFKSRASLSLSYSNRQNIIYYETYKSFLDRLLETESQQGYQLQASYRPMKKLSVGATGGYRFRKSDPRPSKNLYAYATYSQIPGLNAAATISATLMETSYLNGNIYSLGLTRDLIRGKLSSTFTYRYIDYRFVNSESGQVQNTGELSFNWKIIRNLSCSLYYEGTVEKKYTYNRFYVQLSRRF